MAGSRIRVRLLFDDCTPSRPGSVGRRRCWFLLNSDACRLVTDVEYCIRETFCLGKSTQIELYLDDFVLPPFEKSELIRENDIIRVKLLSDIQRDSSPRQDQVPESELSDEDTGNLRKKKRKKTSKETVQNGGTGSEIGSSTACVSNESARTKKEKGRQNKEKKKKESKNKQDLETATGKAPTSTGQSEIRRKQTEADKGKSKQSSPRSRNGNPENGLDVAVRRKQKSSSVTPGKRPGQKGRSRKGSTSSSSSSSSEEESVRDKSSKLQNGVAKKVSDQSAGKARKDAAPKVASKSAPNISQPPKVTKVDQVSGSGTDDSDSSSTESSSTEEDDARMTRIKKLPLSKTGKGAAVKDTRNAKRAVATVGKLSSGKPNLPPSARGKVPAKNNATSAVPSVGKSSSSRTVKAVNGKANSKDTSSSSSSSSSSDSEVNDLSTSHDRVQGGDKVKDPSTASTSLQQNAPPESPPLVPAVKTINSTPVPSRKTAAVNNVRQSASKSKAGHVRFSSGSDADSDSDSHAASSSSIIRTTEEGHEQVAMQCDAAPAEGSDIMDENCSTPPSITGHTDIQKRLQSLSGHHPPCPMGPSPRPTPKAASPKPPPKAPSPKPPPRDYSSCPPLVGPPRPGDVIAYKTLELSSSYTPEVSAYKEGEVLNMNHATTMIELRLSDPSMGEEPSREGGRFELEQADAGAEADAGVEAEGEAKMEIGPQQPTVAPPASRVVSVTLHSLIEPKLIT